MRVIVGVPAVLVFVLLPFWLTWRLACLLARQIRRAI